MAWSQQTSGFGTTSIFGVAFGNSQWVAAGASGKLATSSDGSSWTQRTSSFGTSGINCVGYGGGLWVACGASGKLATSSDGVSWTQQSPGFGTSTILSVAYSNGLWVATGTVGKLATSSNGINWTMQSPGFGTQSVYNARYSADLGLWIAAAGGSQIATSSDGASWTMQTHPFSAGLALYGIACGSGVVVVAGGSGEVCISTDGINWTAKSSGFGATNIRWAGYGVDGFYLVGESGKMSKSTDGGSTWSTVTSSFSTTTIYSIDFGSNLWVAAGASGKIANCAASVPLALTPTIGQIAIIGQGWVNNFAATAAQLTIALTGFVPKSHIDTFKKAALLGAIDVNGGVPGVAVGHARVALQRTIGVVGQAPTFINRFLQPLATNWVGTRYQCVLTGVADGKTDLILPIKSFQSRYSDLFIYLSCVVPGVDDYQSEIDLRRNGRLIISRIYRYEDSSESAYVMVNVPFETLRLDQGGRSGMTATLSGSDSITYFSPQTVDCYDPIYYSSTDGAKRRYRCQIDPRLRNGDTVNINGESFTVGSIIHIVDVNSTIMEIAEV